MLKAIALIGVLASTAQAENYTVYPHRGEIVSANSRPCGPKIRAELQDIIADTPVIMMNTEDMVVHFGVQRRVERPTKADQTYLSEPIVGVFHTPGRTLLVALYQQRGPIPVVEISLIRGFAPVCYEKWVGNVGPLARMVSK